MGNAASEGGTPRSPSGSNLDLRGNLTESMRTGDGPIELLRHKGNRNHATEQKQLNAMKKTFKRCQNNEKNEVSVHELVRHLALLHVFSAAAFEELKSELVFFSNEMGYTLKTGEVERLITLEGIYDALNATHGDDVYKALVHAKRETQLAGESNARSAFVAAREFGEGWGWMGVRGREGGKEGGRKGGREGGREGERGRETGKEARRMGS